MTLTVKLESPLAEELRQEASSAQVSPEELAHQLVREALDQRVAARRWHGQNQRRLELIAKKLNSPLTASETEELRQLQSLAGQMAGPFDSALHQTVCDLRRAIDYLPQGQLP